MKFRCVRGIGGSIGQFGVDEDLVGYADVFLKMTAQKAFHVPREEFSRTTRTL